MKERILIISFSDMKNDPRVYRQIIHLRKNYKVMTAGFAGPEIDGVPFYRIGVHRNLPAKLARAMWLKTGRFDRYYERSFDTSDLLDHVHPEDIDLVLANDNDSLPLAFSFGPTPVIHDAHEYSPRQYEDRAMWRFLEQKYRVQMCERYLPGCAGTITVCPGIAEEYHKVYGIDPVVITNSTEYRDMIPSPVEPDNIRIIAHGIANPSRHIESMIEVMDLTDHRFSLDLMLVPTNQKYYRKLQRMVQDRENVRLIPPVPMADIVPHTNGYDIGLHIIQPHNFNQLHSLPNKLFEFIQARLAVAIGPSPEMAYYVKKYGCGIVAKDFEPRSMAEALNSLDAESIAQMKTRSDQAASEVTSENNMKALDDIVERVLSSRVGKTPHIVP